MKKIIIKVTLITLLLTNFAYSIDPTYDLHAKNFVFIAPNILEFSIFLKHTNPAQTNFPYSMGQYVFNFNTAFANGGTLTYSYSPTAPTSNLETYERPVNPTVFNNQLRLSTNTPGIVDNATLISSSADGTLIARMRLSTSASSFSGTLDEMNIFWANPVSGFPNFAYPSTKIFAFVGYNAKYIVRQAHLISLIPLNEISGKVFIDENRNGVFDAGDSPYRNAIISLNSGEQFITTNTSGDYAFTCHLGIFYLSMTNIPYYHSINPSIHTFNFTAYGNSNSGNNFALQYGVANDLRITLSSSVYRPGFDAWQAILYRNIGTTTKSGTVVLNYDPNLVVTGYINPPPTSHNLVTRTLIWDYSNLLPGSASAITVMYTLTATVPLGRLLHSIAAINPITGDYTPYDNTFFNDEYVRGSCDPNEKGVEPSGSITPQAVADQDSLIYTIRFQNTGTDTAFTVRILDTLSSKLNAGTFDLVGTSHPCTYSIRGAGIVEWTFNNILLPDSTTNEVRSHGFIQYRIKPKNNLVLGDKIRNTAHIYFDFNEPVATNTVETEIANPLRVLDLRFRLQAMHPVLDTVKVLLRSSESPYPIIDSAKVFSELNGANFRVRAAFEEAVNGSSYFIVLKHRNSIETWSAEPVQFSSDTTLYDFTISSDKAYGNNMIISDGFASIFSGDVNQDGVVDSQDMMRVDNDVINIATGYLATDLNGDRLLDGTDISVVDNNTFNFVTKVTPPLSAAMNPINNTAGREVSLSQNYPNPFNPSTKISFNLPQESNVKLAIYDMTGREIATLVNTRLTAGNHQYDWNASSFASGVYFFKITAGSFSEVRKMTLIK